MGEVEDALLELQTDEVEDTTVDDEEVIEVFVKGESDSSDNEEELADRGTDDEQDYDLVASPSGIRTHHNQCQHEDFKGILLTRLREQLLYLRVRKKF